MEKKNIVESIGSIFIAFMSLTVLPGKLVYT